MSRTDAGFFFAVVGTGYAASALYLGTPLMGKNWFEVGTLSFEIAKGAPAALGTLVIGAVAVYVAYQQWLVGRAKFKLDLFTKRYDVYVATQKFVDEVLHNDAHRISDFPVFGRERHDAAFLFGSDLTAYIEEIFARAVLLWEISDEKRDLIGGMYLEPHRLAQRSETREWLRLEVAAGIRNKFAPYLDLSVWK